MARTRAINRVSAIGVVSKLLENSDVCQRRVQLSDRLGIPNHITKQLNYQYNRGELGWYVYFKEIIETWVNREGYEIATVEQLIDVFRNLEMLSAAEALEPFLMDKPTPILLDDNNDSRNRTSHQNQQEHTLNDSPSSPLPNCTIRFAVKQSTNHFVGRTKCINSLKEMHRSKRSACVLLTGYPGIGKTTLVEKFAADKPQSETLAWLNGNSSLELMETFNEFCNSTEGNHSKDNLSVSQRIYKFGNLVKLNPYRFVIVIDGVEELFKELEEIIVEILKMRKEIFLIVISRRRNILLHELELFVIEKLSDVDSHALSKVLFEKREINVDSFQLDNFCNYVDGHPLSIVSGVNTIYHQRLNSIYGSDYNIKQYLTDQQSLLRIFSPDVPFQNSIDKIINDPILGNIAENIVIVLSLMPSENVHFSSLVKIYLTTCENENEQVIRRATELFIHHNMIYSQSCIISIDSIPHAAIRDKCKFRITCPQHLISFWRNFPRTVRNNPEYFNETDKHVVKYIWDLTVKHKEVLSLVLDILVCLLGTIFDEDEFVNNVCNTYVGHFGESSQICLAVERDFIIARLKHIRTDLVTDKNKYMLLLQEFYKKIVSCLGAGHEFVRETYQIINVIVFPSDSRIFIPKTIDPMEYLSVIRTLRLFYCNSALLFSKHGSNDSFCSLIDEKIINKSTLLLGILHSRFAEHKRQGQHSGLQNVYKKIQNAIDDIIWYQNI